MDNPAKRGAPRSSLACLPCRSRHLKCDGTRPVCQRCSDANAAQGCNYAKSRRGGLDRAALAERRKRLAAAEKSDGGQPVSITKPVTPAPVMIDYDSGFVNNKPSSTDSGLGSPIDYVAEVRCIEDDCLVESYYRNFHKFHPLVLPRRCLTRLYRDPQRQHILKPLIDVLRLFGYIYSVKQWPAEAGNIIEESLSQAPSQNPFTVQCRLLYSIALFWYDDKESSARQKKAACDMAMALGMHHREFALEHGEGDPILAESWRRTWWWNYIIEAYFLGTLGTLEFAVLDVEASVDLPCQEHEYESGNIPEPKSQQDYDNREFLDEDTPFSSFAHLIGAVKCAATAITTVPKILSGEASAQMLQAADSMLEGWLLLLPDAPKHVMSKEGEIDELLYQAFMVVNVAAIGLHRPLSELRFNQVESVSSCAREPPREIPTPDLVNVHTVRVLRATEAQIRLLALPVRPFHHTPFTTCMVSEGALALLSACHFQLKDKDLQIARDQVRMTLGCLKAIGEIWPRTRRNVKEIQTIARHIFGLGGKVASKETPRSDEVPSLSSGNDASFSSEGEQSGGDFLSSLGDFDICGFDPLGEQMVNIGDMDGGMSWWMNEP